MNQHDKLFSLKVIVIRTQTHVRNRLLYLEIKIDLKLETSAVIST